MSIFALCDDIYSGEPRLRAKTTAQSATNLLIDALLHPHLHLQ